MNALEWIAAIIGVVFIGLVTGIVVGHKLAAHGAIMGVDHDAGLGL